MDIKKAFDTYHEKLFLKNENRGNLKTVEAIMSSYRNISNNRRSTTRNLTQFQDRKPKKKTKQLKIGYKW